MSQNSSIEWTDTTWNPVRGCTKVSPGCAHCYAETFAERFRGVKDHPYEQGFDLRLVPEKLAEPLSWKTPRRVFVNSMSDLFQDGVPDEYIDRVFAVMALAPPHTFQVLTKRADRMRGYLNDPYRKMEVARHIHARVGDEAARAVVAGWSWPLPNVWLGVSVENQHFADERIPLLLQTPAAVRFISAEPLLGPVDVNGYVKNLTTHHLSVDVKGALANRSFDYLTDNGRPMTRGEAEAGLRALLDQGVKRIKATDECIGFSDQTGCPGHPHQRLDWVIVGGESGHGARPFAHDWARSIVAQCKAANVAVFVKQLGSHHYPIYVTNKDGVFIGGTTDLSGRRSKGNDMAEWPEDLRVREFPQTVTA